MCKPRGLINFSTDINQDYIHFPLFQIQSIPNVLLFCDDLFSKITKYLHKYMNIVRTEYNK